MLLRHPQTIGWRCCYLSQRPDWVPVVPEKRETGLCPDSDVGNMVLSEDIGAGDGGKLRPETDIGAF
jgi:hypothetical protein